MVNYKTGKIYKIFNDLTDDIYVGSTCVLLSIRMVRHREESKKKPNRLFYKFLIEKEGWDNFRIILIEDYLCDRKEELLQREEYWRKKLKAILNVLRAITIKKRKKNKNANMKKTRKKVLKSYLL